MSDTAGPPTNVGDLTTEHVLAAARGGKVPENFTVINRVPVHLDPDSLDRALPTATPQELGSLRIRLDRRLANTLEQQSRTDKEFARLASVLDRKANETQDEEERKKFSMGAKIARSLATKKRNRFVQAANQDREMFRLVERELNLPVDEARVRFFKKVVGGYFGWTGIDTVFGDWQRLRDAYGFKGLARDVGPTPAILSALTGVDKLGQLEFSPDVRRGEKFIGDFMDPAFTKALGLEDASNLEKFLIGEGVAGLGGSQMAKKSAGAGLFNRSMEGGPLRGFIPGLGFIPAALGIKSKREKEIQESLDRGEPIELSGGEKVMHFVGEVAAPVDPATMFVRPLGVATRSAGLAKFGLGSLMPEVVKRAGGALARFSLGKGTLRGATTLAGGTGGFFAPELGLVEGENINLADRFRMGLFSLAGARVAPEIIVRGKKLVFRNGAHATSAARAATEGGSVPYLSDEIIAAKDEFSELLLAEGRLEEAAAREHYLRVRYDTRPSHLEAVGRAVARGGEDLKKILQHPDLQDLGFTKESDVLDILYSTQPELAKVLDPKGKYKPTFVDVFDRLKIEEGLRSTMEPGEWAARETLALDPDIPAEFGWSLDDARRWLKDYHEGLTRESIQARDLIGGSLAPPAQPPAIFQVGDTVQLERGLGQGVIEARTKKGYIVRRPDGSRFHGDAIHMDRIERAAAKQAQRVRRAAEAPEPRGATLRTVREAPQRPVEAPQAEISPPATLESPEAVEAAGAAVREELATPAAGRTQRAFREDDVFDLMGEDEAKALALRLEQEGVFTSGIGDLDDAQIKELLRLTREDETLRPVLDRNMKAMLPQELPNPNIDPKTGKLLPEVKDQIAKKVDREILDLTKNPEADRIVRDIQTLQKKGVDPESDIIQALHRQLEEVNQGFDDALLEDFRIRLTKRLEQEAMEFVPPSSRPSVFKGARAETITEEGTLKVGEAIDLSPSVKIPQQKGAATVRKDLMENLGWPEVEARKLMSPKWQAERNWIRANRKRYTDMALHDAKRETARARRLAVEKEATKLNLFAAYARLNPDEVLRRRAAGEALFDNWDEAAKFKLWAKGKTDEVIDNAELAKLVRGAGRQVKPLERALAKQELVAIGKGSVRPATLATKKGPTPRQVENAKKIVAEIESGPALWERDLSKEAKSTRRQLDLKDETLWSRADLKRLMAEEDQAAREAAEFELRMRNGTLGRDRLRLKRSQRVLAGRSGEVVLRSDIGGLGTLLGDLIERVASRSALSKILLRDGAVLRKDQLRRLSSFREAQKLHRQQMGMNIEDRAMFADLQENNLKAAMKIPEMEIGEFGVGAIGAFARPVWLLAEKYGGPHLKMVARSAFDAITNLWRGHVQPLVETTDHYLRLFDGDARKRIFRALDAGADPKKLRSAAENDALARQAIAGLSGEERQAAEFLQDIFEHMFVMQNQMRRSLGMKPVARRGSYVTHIFDNMVDKRHYTDGLDRLDADDAVSKFLKAREGDKDYIDDVALATRAYMNATFKDIVWTPVLKDFSMIRPFLKNNHTKRTLQKGLEMAAGIHRPWMDKNIFFKGRDGIPPKNADKILRASTAWIYVKSLGASPRAVLVNLTQSFFTVANVGPIYTVRALGTMMKHGIGLNVVGGVAGGAGGFVAAEKAELGPLGTLLSVGVGAGAGASGGKRIGKAIRKMSPEAQKLVDDIHKIVPDIDRVGSSADEDFALAMPLMEKLIHRPEVLGAFGAAEQFNRILAALAGKFEAEALLKRGVYKTQDEVMAHARRVVRDTQFWYTALDRPQVLSEVGSVGRPFVTFQQFRMRALDFFYGRAEEAGKALLAGDTARVAQIGTNMAAGIGLMAGTMAAVGMWGVDVTDDMGLLPVELMQDVMQGDFDRWAPWNTPMGQAVAEVIGGIGEVLGVEGMDGDINMLIEQLLKPLVVQRLQNVQRMPMGEDGSMLQKAEDFLASPLGDPQRVARLEGKGRIKNQMFTAPFRPPPGYGNFDAGDLVYLTRSGNVTGVKATPRKSRIKGLGFRLQEETEEFDASAEIRNISQEKLLGRSMAFNPQDIPPKSEAIERLASRILQVRLDQEVTMEEQRELTELRAEARFFFPSDAKLNQAIIAEFKRRRLTPRQKALNTIPPNRRREFREIFEEADLLEGVRF